MHFPLAPPWSSVLAVVSNLATLYLGYLFARWRTRRRFKALEHDAKHAWDGWDERDVDQELHGYKALCPVLNQQSQRDESYRTAIETFVDIGGYLVVFHPGDVFRVERVRGSEREGRPSALFEDAAKLYEALTGQSDVPLNYTIAVRCLTCKRPARLEVRPIEGTTLFELVQPKGWLVMIEHQREPRAFSVQCPACQVDILHEHKPDA